MVHLRIHELKDAATTLERFFPSIQANEHQCEEGEVCSKCGEYADTVVKCILNRAFANPMPVCSDRT